MKLNKLKIDFFFSKRKKILIMNTILFVLFYYTICVRPILWIIHINPYTFHYEVLKIENKDEYIIHRYWWNIINEFLFFLLFPMKVKYISL